MRLMGLFTSDIISLGAEKVFKRPWQNTEGETGLAYNNIIFKHSYFAKFSHFYQFHDSI